MPPTSPQARTQAGRDRLLATARRLFTSRGASNVGINDVTAAAGVARMTLYNNFPSKDALIDAVYQEMVDAELADLRRITAGPMSEEAGILAIFDHYDRDGAEEGFRGCPFIHASLQMADPAGSVLGIVRHYKRSLRDHVLAMLNDTRANRTELADQILLLLDGAVTEAYLQGADAPVKAAKRAASILLRAV